MGECWRLSAQCVANYRDMYKALTRQIKKNGQNKAAIRLLESVESGNSDWTQLIS